jgi:hypothetical protein
MKFILPLFFIVTILWRCNDKTTETETPFTVTPYDPSPVAKSNATKVYAHYMPWFESKEINGAWGMHWTMSTRDPENITDGKREIASHFYPMIGPYSSMDQDVIEYHLLLMKLSGIDGVLIDWYGSHDVNDYRQNLINTNALIDRLDETGLTFGIVYEEITANHVANQGVVNSDIEAAQADMTYMNQNYFTNSQYIYLNERPLLLTFGPRHFEDPADWTLIFEDTESKPLFLTLWYESAEAGSNAQGEFAWVYQNNLDDLDHFYTIRAKQLEQIMGSTYPGFLDYYVQGGWGDQIGWSIAHNGTATFSATLNKAAAANVDLLQLVTWNDFGEGTMIEPTEEFGFSFLKLVQLFCGISYNEHELELVYQLYALRKKYKNSTNTQFKLNQVFYYLVALKMEEAETLLNEIE